MSYPALYQVPARDWLLRFGRGHEPEITLTEIPDEELDRIQRLGFGWLYLLGVWQTGRVGKEISAQNNFWRPGYFSALSDFHESDVSGSPFAVSDYRVHSDFGGDAALEALRIRLQARGIQLMLDFVPNHTAIDHVWVKEHHDRYIHGDTATLARQPENYVRVGDLILAHGRDPYFPGWVDTLQLDYSNPETAPAMGEELRRVASRCDGVRCDMAMLLLPDVFERTWGKRIEPFWPAAIEHVRSDNPEFMFMAEVYWGREWELQQQGFDYTYDKTLYDRILEGDAGRVRSHLNADIVYQRKLTRFLENHDEHRIASLLTVPAEKAAALITYGVPGLRFFHDGQLEGAKRKPSVHLGRREREQEDPELKAFYVALLQTLKRGYAEGEWRLLEARRAWCSNWTAECFVCFAWLRGAALRDLIVINFSDHQSQCLIPLDSGDLLGRVVKLSDRVSTVIYERDGNELAASGLFVDLGAWQGHWFSVE